jgi:predicted nucleotidyltransferase
MDGEDFKRLEQIIVNFKEEVKAEFRHQIGIQSEHFQQKLDPDQPRKVIEPDALAELAASIKKHGILQPILFIESFFRREAERFRVQAAVLYGSWAGGFPRRDSDVDVAVVFEDEPDDDTAYRRLMDMSLLLSDLTGREVDMIPIDRDFRKPMLYYNALVQGVPVYRKRDDDIIRLRKRAIDEMEDFSLFGLQWQAEIARRNLDALKNA